MRFRTAGLVSLLAVSGLFVGLSPLYPQNRVVGQVQFVGAAKDVKSSGVWVDGQYVGYLGELNGANRLRLLPGEHEIVVRQAGYEDFSQRVTIEPGKVLDVHAVMEKNSQFQYPDAKTAAEVRLNVRPGRAAVFLDDNFVGHIDEFYGVGHGMLVFPGKHRIKIALAGYRAFETEVTLLPRQKFTLETVLLAGSINDADPLIRNDQTAPLRATSSPGDQTSQSK